VLVEVVFVRQFLSSVVSDAPLPVSSVDKE
jgi:hypothetical protein